MSNCVQLNKGEHRKLFGVVYVLESACSWSLSRGVLASKAFIWKTESAQVLITGRDKECTPCLTLLPS